MRRDRLDPLVESAIAEVAEAHRIVERWSRCPHAGGGAVLDVRGRALEIDPDLTRRWSGVVAATPRLAEEIASAVLG